MSKKPRLLLVLLAIFTAFALLAAACGGDDDDKAKDTPKAGATAAATTAATAAPTFAADSTMGKIVAAKKITFGVKFDQPGFGVKDAIGGKLDGFDIAIAKEIGKSLGLSEDQIKFEEAVSKNRIPYLQEDKVDVVIATFTINEERKTQIEFSKPYYQAGQSILVKKENADIKTAADLNGKDVCTVQGSTPAQTLAAKYPQAKLLLLDVYSACVQAMKDGRVAAVSTDNVILLGFADKDPGVKLVGGLFTDEPYGIGVKKGKTDMQAYINAQLDRMFKDGTWDKIYDQYLGKFEGLPKAAEARSKLPAAP
ncbi:MAG: glutamate ABC transporter substrate-binding protein [Tepidiformaceae bacterium]